MPQINISVFIVAFFLVTSMLQAEEPFHWKRIPKETTQVLHAKTAASKNIQGELKCFQRNGEQWDLVGTVIPIVVERNGITSPAIKKEGDGKTPSGLYRIGLAFGYKDQADTHLKYQKMTKEDIWIDDEKSPDYNRLVKTPTKAKSFELMRRGDDAYKLGAVIEYNTMPVIAGKGSAIFLHIWSGKGKPTDGCIAASEGNMGIVFRWLDQKANPLILIETE